MNDHISIRAVALILISSFAAIGGLYYFATHPPAWSKPYYRAVGRKMRRLRRWRGRPGESRLLRWAEEELPTFGLDEDECVLPFSLIIIFIRSDGELVGTARKTRWSTRARKLRWD